MELTKRERSQLIAGCVIIAVCVILIFTLDLIIAAIIPSPSESWGYLKFLMIIPMIISIINIIWIVMPRKLTPDIVESSEIQEGELNEELMNAGVMPSGQILQVIRKVAYSDPMYARKPVRAWPWRAKGKIVLTTKELIFVSVKKKKTYFSIPISNFKSIQYFVARGGSRRFKVCEIVYQNPDEEQRESALFMGTIGFSTFDMPSEIELKSMKLMDAIQKWYDTWVEEPTKPPRMNI